MIDVDAVLPDIPHFERFCSVAKLHALVEGLRSDARFRVEVAGSSVKGVPIHHVRSGAGRIKALVVAFPHCMEVIGGMTVFSLLTLLRQGHRALCDADVEWHIVPCIDPDGALLNEGWSQEPFTFERYMKHFHAQPYLDQVDFTFPFRYGNLKWDRPTPEAKVLQGILDEVRPAFFYSLHDARPCSASWYYLSRNIESEHYLRLQALLRRHDVPLREHSAMMGRFERFADGVYEVNSLKRYFAHLEQRQMLPQGELTYGGGSIDYLESIRPDALSFVAELTYVRPPERSMHEPVGRNLRQIFLRVDADNKFVLTQLLEEWERVKDSVDTASPFYRKTVQDLIVDPQNLCEGAPQTRAMRDILFNAAYNVTAAPIDWRDAHLSTVGRYGFLCQAYEFVRLLKASRQTPVIRVAIERLEGIFDEALSDIAREIDLPSFEVIDCDTLARVQLGSGLIALNSVLESKSC